MKRQNKISYVKKPLAVHSFYSLGLSIAALLLFAGGMYLSVSSQGNGGMTVGAVGLSSILFTLFSLWYSFQAFMEKEKNYILAKISGGAGIVLLIVWLVMIIVGFGG